MTAFLNCYLRETGGGEWHAAERVSREVGSPDQPGQDVHPLQQMHLMQQVRITLPRLSLTLVADAEYRSPTGRHRFRVPVYMACQGNEPVPIDGLTFVSLLVQNFSLSASERYGESGCRIGGHAAELLSRVIQSCSLLEAMVGARLKDAGRLYSPALTFIEAEQALLFGHSFHPSPKSRQGFPEWRQQLYSPETKGSFRLYYYALHRRVVAEDSAWSSEASEITRTELINSMRGLDESFGSPNGRRLVHYYLSSKDYAIVPVHPVQAEWLLHEPVVQRWLRDGTAVALGELGPAYWPTSSIRTVYHPESSYMYKLSLRVKITNSMRVNKRKELAGALEASRLMDRIQPKLSEAYPGFHIIADAAWITASDPESDAYDDGESGFELIIRHNPFRGEQAERTFVIAALTQEPLPGCTGALPAIVGSRSGEDGRSQAQHGLDWFRRYLAISLDPLLWLYDNYGIALEAHQQNGVVQLDERGYPERFYYRDSQGYYYAHAKLGDLEELLPGIRSSVNAYDDRIVAERFGYYLIVNHLCGIIQAFGAAGCADERLLLAELHAALEGWAARAASPHTARFIQGLLTSPTYAVKANLLTRLHDIDELDNELEQAVYTQIPNPFLTELPRAESIRKARAVTLHWRKERAHRQPIEIGARP